MADSTVTFINKYIQQRGSAAGRSGRAHRLKSESGQSLPDNKANVPMKSGFAGNDRYDNTIRHFTENDYRLQRQNQMALKVRHANHTLRKIDQGLQRMKDSLDAIVKQYPPYPPGSKERIAVLKEVGALRREIEKLTFPPQPDESSKRLPSAGSSFSLTTEKLAMESLVDDAEPAYIPKIQAEFNSSGHIVPVVADEADDHEIRNSIVELTRTGGYVRRQRQQLQSDTSRMFDGGQAIHEQQVAEHKSLFIGKQLSHHLDNDLTTQPSILRGMLN